MAKFISKNSKIRELYKDGLRIIFDKLGELETDDKKVIEILRKESFVKEIIEVTEDIVDDSDVIEEINQETVLINQIDINKVENTSLYEEIE